MNEGTSTAHAWIDAHRARLSEWTRTIWDLAEPAWREYRSAAWYAERLRAEGFAVEEASGGMPTAFSATWEHGAGPAVLTYAEYDAVPGNSQAADVREAPRPGTSRFAPGHTDPHSALGIGALAALLATKAAMERHGIGGTLRFTGEPAEKVQGSKVVHGLRGYYDGLDAIVSFHPFYMLPLCNTVRWDTHCGAYFSLVYVFESLPPEGWARGTASSPIPAAHASARAPGANVALTSMYGLTKATLESMLPHAGGWSMNEAILAAGNYTADNLTPPLAMIQYAWRTPDVEMAEAVLRVLDENAEAAARAAHCRVTRRWVARNRPGVPNHALARACWGNLELAGPPRYGEEAVAVARAIQTELGEAAMDEPFMPACSTLVAPEEAERQLRAGLPSWQRNFTSDDYVEMTWYAPTVRLYVGRPMLRRGAAGADHPAWVGNALGGIPATIDPTVQCAARVISGTLLDVLVNADLVREARTEFERRTQGEERIDPLLDATFSAPVDLPWPEYVTTARGEGWGNPYAG